MEIDYSEHALTDLQYWKEKVYIFTNYAEQLGQYKLGQV